MGWKDLEFRERVSLMTSGLQAAATFGMFLVALIGIWKVTPIITYQVEQQQSELAQIAPEPHTHPLVVDALGWWSGHMRNYNRLVEILGEAESGGLDVSFEIQEGAGEEIAPDLRPDLLVVSAIDTAGKQEVISVPVNHNAMAPSQYIRCMVNQGAFESLPDTQRRNVEIAVERYINRVMVPVVPPLIVRADMSLQELRFEISVTEHHRDEALRHIKGLEEIVTAALQQS
jgi:hypothetical protein